MIPQEIIDDVRAATNIVEVVQQYVQLRQTGPNWKGLCPFHEEKTPSFNVNQPRQIFHCFGCGEGGNVFTFVQKLENRSFPEVVEDLAARVGIEVPKDEDPEAAKRRSENDDLMRANEAAARFFREQYLGDAGRAAREYVESRGFNAQIIEEHNVGYCGPGWEAFSDWCRARRHPMAIAEKAGLVVQGKRGYYDRFAGRLTFPIVNNQSRILGFSGRLIDDEQDSRKKSPKYLNTADTPIYKKERVLFGLDIARPAIGKAERVLVAEGQFDVVALHQAGFREALATCGTALTAGHLKLLRRFTTNFVLVYDGDSAGKKAALRSLPLFLEAEVAPHVVLLPDDHDPDTYIKEHSADAFAKLVDSAIPLPRFYVMEARKASKPGVAGRVDVMKRLAKTFKVCGEVARAEYAAMVADLFDLPEHLVVAEFEGRLVEMPPKTSNFQAKWTRKRFDKRQPEREVGGPLSEDDKLVPVLEKRRKAEEIIIKLMLGSPGVAANVSRDGILESFSDDRLRALGQLILDASDQGTRRVEVADLLDKAADDRSRRILETLSPEDDAVLSENVEEIFHNCTRRIRTQSLEERRKRLLSALTEAQRAGDDGLVVSLQQEVAELHRQAAELKQA